MQKIVIMSDNSEKNNMLIEYLTLLFPECEVELLATPKRESRAVFVGSEGQDKRDERK